MPLNFELNGCGSIDNIRSHKHCTGNHMVHDQATSVQCHKRERGLCDQKHALQLNGCGM